MLGLDATVRYILAFNPGLAVTGKLYEDTHNVTYVFTRYFGWCVQNSPGNT